MPISVPPTGWWIEVTLPSGHVVTPDVVGEPSRNPQANGFPKLEVPVRDREVWHNLDLTQDIAMDVWFNALPQPVDQLETVKDSEGATVELIGRGGLELETRDRRSVSYEAAHKVAENIITDATPYAANVDRPNTTVDTNQIVQSADTAAEWSDRRAESPATSPINVVSSLSTGDGEGETLAQTARVREANNIGDKRVSTLITPDNGNASDGDAVDLEAVGDYVELDWPLDYTVPGEDIRLAVRWRPPDDPDGDSSFETPDVDFLFNGTQVGGFGDGANIGSDAYRWDIINPNDITSVSDQTSPTFRVEVSGNSSNGVFRTDLMAMFDARYHDGSSFDNSTDSNNYLATPTLYPIGATKSNFPTQEFDNAQSSDAVVGGRVEVTVDDADGLEELALSNDRGETFATSGAGTDTFETDFSDEGPSLRLRLTLSGLPTTRTTATPTQGFEAPELDSYVLKADLEDLPLVVDQQFDGSAMSSLRTIAEDLADFIFEFRVDRAGNKSVEFTTPGQRTTDRSEQLASYETTETDVPRVDKVVVKGSSRRVEGEQFTASVGSYVDLNEDDIQLGRSAVTEPSTGTVYTEGQDYDIDPDSGRIKALSQGDLVGGQTYEIDYYYRPSGSSTIPSPPADPRTEVITVPALASSRACEQAAKRILEQVDEPITEATVTIPNDTVGWDIVSAISLDPLPGGFDNLEIRDVENTPEQTVLRLGSRETIGDVVGRLQSRLEATSKRV